MRSAALTVVAMCAFAANSILCRAALGDGRIDAASFSTLRLVAGAAALCILLAARGRPRFRGGSWSAAAMLFGYAVPFSFAYESLSTGTGALILFGAVQSTMLFAAVAGGERPHPLQWLGIATALVGLVYLVLPGVSAPDPLSAGLMAAAGVAWGLYSLRGRGASQPLADTAGNFLRSVPMVAALSAVSLEAFEITTTGAVLAVASGALASGAGYAIWYAALAGLTATGASVVQLSVPVLAALGGVVFMAEAITVRLAIASLLILGGVGLALTRRARA